MFSTDNFIVNSIFRFFKLPLVKDLIFLTALIDNFQQPLMVRLLLKHQKNWSITVLPTLTVRSTEKKFCSLFPKSLRVVNTETI